MPHWSTFVRTIAISNFCMHYFNWQYLDAPLLMTAFVYNITNWNFRMNYYNSRQLLYVLLQLQTISAGVLQ